MCSNAPVFYPLSAFLHLFALPFVLRVSGFVSFYSFVFLLMDVISFLSWVQQKLQCPQCPPGTTFQCMQTHCPRTVCYPGHKTRRICLCSQLHFQPLEGIITFSQWWKDSFHYHLPQIINFPSSASSGTWQGVEERENLGVQQILIKDFH